jgi:transposase-like protein
MNCPRCNSPDVYACGPGHFACKNCGNLWTVPNDPAEPCKKPLNLFLSQGGLVVNPEK